MEVQLLLRTLLDELYNQDLLHNLLPLDFANCKTSRFLHKEVQDAAHLCRGQRSCRRNGGDAIDGAP